MKRQRILQIIFGIGFAALLVFVFTREPKQPALPRWEAQQQLLERAEEKRKTQVQADADKQLVKRLLSENLSEREFDFPMVVEAATNRRVIPLARMTSSAQAVGILDLAVKQVIGEMNATGSPIRDLERINEGSKHFEDALQRVLDAADGWRCEFPKTVEGQIQRSGYPDLVLKHEKTGEVFYIDPKLMEKGSQNSRLRTFYYEPKTRTSKITEHAAHLLIGIEHDGVDGAWQFGGYRLVDLSGLKVRLKTEFQASNQDVYSGRSVLETSKDAGKDGAR